MQIRFCPEYDFWVITEAQREDVWIENTPAGQARILQVLNSRVISLRYNRNAEEITIPDFIYTEELPEWLADAACARFTAQNVSYKGTRPLQLKREPLHEPKPINQSVIDISELKFD